MASISHKHFLLSTGFLTNDKRRLEIGISIF